jgi:hypothetical protein
LKNGGAVGPEKLRRYVNFFDDPPRLDDLLPAAAFTITAGGDLPRSSGQWNYAAIFISAFINSKSTGLT